MAKDQAASGVSFGAYRLELGREQLWRGGRAVKVTGKAFGVLRYLVEHPGQLVTKDELFQAVWPRTVVTDSTLTSCIQELRQALRDDAKQPRYIETVHRRGYRFLPAVGTHPVASSQVQVPSLESQPSRLSPQHSVLVGRETELTQLHGWLSKALEGERQVVFVTGEAGIGKTALVEAFLAGRGQEGANNGKQERQKAKGKNRTPNPQYPTPLPWISWGQCIEHYGAGEPYLPVLEAVGRLCRGSDGRQVIDLLAQQAPTWLVQLPALLNPTEMETLQRKTAGATKERMLRELAEAVEILTAERPLVVWLEDLHWGDPSTLDWLAFLARRRERARLLVLGSYRPVEVIMGEHPLRAVKQELQLHGQCTELALGLLSEGAVAQYLAQRVSVGARRAVPLLARAIHRRTDGNPLFMVTVVEQLVAAGVLPTEGDGDHEAAALATIEQHIPENLRQLIEQQFERLSLEDRRLLEAASVARLEFSAAAVAAGVETTLETVEEQCAELARRGQFLQAVGIVEWPDGTVAGQYRFLHALYQEVIHGRLSEGRRRTLHRRIGERKEQAYGDQAREIATELAIHFEQSRDYQRAVQYLLQAGENAIRQSANQEAIALLMKGLEVLRILPDTLQRNQLELMLQLASGLSLIAVKGWAAPEVGQAYARARELCRQIRDTPQLSPVLYGLWSFYVVRAEYQTAHELAEQCLTFGQSIRDSALLLEAHAALGATSLWVGDFSSTRELLNRGIELYDPQRHSSLVFSYGSADPGVICLSFTAWTLWFLGYPNQALKKSCDALILAKKLLHPFSLTWALSVAARVHQLRQEVSTSWERAEETVAVSLEQGFSFYLAYGTIQRGWALAEQGCGKEELPKMLQSLAALQTIGTEFQRSFLLSLLAEAYGKTGQPEEGLAALTEALTMVDRTGERFYEAELYRLKGELLLAQEGLRPQAEGCRGNTEEAEACFFKAIEIARKQQAKMWELRATVSLARLWQSQGKKEQARQMLAAIYNWFTEGFDTKDLQEAKGLLEEL